jgi:hypothetical protein
MLSISYICVTVLGIDRPIYAHSLALSNSFDFGRNFGESVRPAFELAPNLGVAKLAPIHLE